MIESATGARAAVREPRRSRWSVGGVLVQTIIVVAAVMAVVPFIYMVTTSFKTYADVINHVLWPWWPFGNEAPQIGNFRVGRSAQGPGPLAPRMTCPACGPFRRGRDLAAHSWRGSFLLWDGVRR